MTDISQRVLIHHLRIIEQTGLVHRDVYAQFHQK